MKKQPASPTHSPWHIEQANLNWQGHTPSSNTFDDVYFSREDAFGEVDYVFIDGNQLKSRFNTHNHSKHQFIIAETGFGTGLNFLCTLKLWLQSSLSKIKQLHFISFEKYPLAFEDLVKAHKDWPELSELCQISLSS